VSAGHRHDVETATRLAELPATSEALESGEIPVGHAQLIARAPGESLTRLSGERRRGTHPLRGGESSTRLSGERPVVSVGKPSDNTSADR